MTDKKKFDPMTEPEQCPSCNDHPSWEEIADGLYQCNNCGVIVNSEGVIVDEADSSHDNPFDENEDELFDKDEDDLFDE